MPSDTALKTMNVLHRGLMKITGGKLGWSASDMPVLELTTVGRKSGAARSCMLTSPWQAGDTMAIVASAGGNDEHPDWYLNLDADPNVAVRTESGTRQMTARTVSGDERTRLWADITRDHANYAGYQSKTDREIPVVVLEPAS